MTAKIYGQEQGKKALLVIDVQENLVNPASKMHMEKTGIDSFLNNVNKSIDDFKARGLPVLYTVNEWSNPVLNWLTGNVCKKGGKGTGLDKRVRIVNDKVYVKSRMNVLTNKKLVSYLKDNSITELYITGLFAEACVKATVKAGIRNNYKVAVIEDAVGAKNRKKKTHSLKYYKRRGATLISTGQF
ncbi:MAG: cysteine hydrolase [Bacteroidota bacterium]|nr:cysteine hydrolase [Bacteroidota bacterium]